MSTPPNDADIESRAAKLWSVYAQTVGDETPWSNVDREEQARWRAVALWTFTNEN